MLFHGGVLLDVGVALLLDVRVAVLLDVGVALLLDVGVAVLLDVGVANKLHQLLWHCAFSLSLHLNILCCVSSCQSETSSLFMGPRQPS